MEKIRDGGVTNLINGKINGNTLIFSREVRDLLEINSMSVECLRNEDFSDFEVLKSIPEHPCIVSYYDVHQYNDFVLLFRDTKRISDIESYIPGYGRVISPIDYKNYRNLKIRYVKNIICQIIDIFKHLCENHVYLQEFDDDTFSIYHKNEEFVVILKDIHNDHFCDNDRNNITYLKKFLCKIVGYADLDCGEDEFNDMNSILNIIREFDVPDLVYF